MKITACVITKNEETNLPVCLESVKSIVSEIIVVDTGSTDRTVEIAKSYGAKVFPFTWIDDFSAARNYAIEQAKSDWIIFLDADEYFAPDCLKFVVGAIREAHQKKLDMVICMMSNIEKQTGKIMSSNLHIRIFRNHPQIRYVGAIHERIVRLDTPAQALDVQKDITIIHTGYSEENLDIQEKGKRNLDLLFKELETKPDSFDVLFYISESYLVDRHYEEALDFALRAERYRNSALKGVYEKNYVNIFQCLVHLSKPREVLLNKIQEAIEAFPNYPDYQFYLGDFYKKESRYWDAIQSYEMGLKLMEQSSIVLSNAFATTTKVLDTVGHLYGKIKDWTQCVHYHVKALQIDKYLYSSLINLLNVLGRFEKPESIYSFITKLYEMQSIKDRLYVLKASLDTNNTFIAERIFAQLPENVPAIKEYKAHYLFLVENYELSFVMYQELYQQYKRVEYAYGAIGAAWRESNHQRLEHLLDSFVDQPSLRNITMNMMREKFLVQIDKKNMFSFFIHVCGVLKITEYKTLSDIVRKSQLLLEVANYLYNQEEYLDAYQFYNEYLEQGHILPKDQLVDLTFKVGDCLLRGGHYDYAWLFLQKAFTLAPGDYRIYAPMLEVAKQMNRQSEVQHILETGLQIYPDSNYLEVVFQKTNL